MGSFTIIKPYYIENLPRILVGLVSLILVDLFQLFIPRIVKRAVDDLTLYAVDIQGLGRYALMILGLGLFIGIFRTVWRRCLLGTARRVEEKVRNRLFDHLQGLSASYFDRTKTGDLMAHATNDILQIRMATGMGLVAFNDAIFLGTAAVAFMLYINIQLTLYVLITMPLIVLGTRFFNKRMHERYLEVQSAFSDVTEAARERFSGIRIIKAHGAEEIEAQRFGAISKDYIDKNIALTKVTGAFFPMMLMLTNLSMAIVLYFGGRRAILAEITPGDLVAFISYLGLLSWPMMALGWVTNLIQRGRASLDRLNKIFETMPEIDENPAAQPLSKVDGRIRMESVDFAYAGQREPVLKKIDLSVKAGQILGIVGPPGSGKTTLLTLLPRLYDANHGRIQLDGNDIRQVKLEHLRRQISYVPQEPFLFAGTIRDNITFGNPHVTPEELYAAADQAAILKDIEAFPANFETVVGEKGVILSGGQKQRIAIARALLKKSPVMLLDDPISQVDIRTGNRIIQTIASLSGTRTVMIVSHRLSALGFAHEIVTLKEGAIVETGTHDELVERGGYYARTFSLQEIEHAL